MKKRILSVLVLVMLATLITMQLPVTFANDTTEYASEWRISDSMSPDENYTYNYGAKIWVSVSENTHALAQRDLNVSCVFHGLNILGERDTKTYTTNLSTNDNGLIKINVKKINQIYTIDCSILDIASNKETDFHMFDFSSGEYKTGVYNLEISDQVDNLNDSGVWIFLVHTDTPSTVTNTIQNRTLMVENMAVDGSYSLVQNLDVDSLNAAYIRLEKNQDFTVSDLQSGVGLFLSPLNNIEVLKFAVPEEEDSTISISENLDSANLNLDNSNLNPDLKITYKLDIPCAIDRTEIIVPNPSNPEYTGEYKARCNSNAFFDELNGIYHFKRNEGYYFNLELTNDLSEKTIDPAVIDSVVLEFYKDNGEVACFSRKMDSVYNEQNKYISKISYTQPNESKDFAYENMSGFINSCGLDTKIDLKTKIYLVSGEVIVGQNTGLIKKITVDSDNSTQIAQANRNKEQNRVQEMDSKPKEVLEERSIPTFKTNQIQKQVGSENQKDSDLFLEIDNSVKKIRSIEKVFQENKIDSKKVVGEIILDTNSSNPEYVFEVKEKRKLFGFIPIGSKIVQKRLSATLNIKE